MVQDLIPSAKSGQGLAIHWRMCAGQNGGGSQQPLEIFDEGVSKTRRDAKQKAPSTTGLAGLLSDGQNPTEEQTLVKRGRPRIDQLARERQGLDLYK